jgi:integrase
MGQIFQRTYKAKDGTFKTCATWTIRYYRNGKPYQESTKFKKGQKGKAQRLLKLREGDIANGVPVTSASVRLTFDQAVADVATDYRINGKRSLAHVERRIKLHLTPFFGGKRLSEITTALVRTFIESRQASITEADGTITPGASNAEINRELAILKRACRLAVQGGTLMRAPHVPMLEERNVRQGFFERDAFETLRGHLPEAVRPVVTFAYLTGWRVPSEVLTLQWPQVDRTAKLIRLEPGETKNSEGRTFPYANLPELDELIEARWQARERLLKARDKICPYVFHRHGEPILTFRKAWKAATIKAGCPGRIPHDFRRTAVRNLIRAGVPEKTAMQLTGHKTRSVFDRYDIVNEQDLRDAVGKLAGEGSGQDRDSIVTVGVQRRRKGVRGRP